MRATSHVTSSSRRNFDTRLLNRENSEVAYCRKFRLRAKNQSASEEVKLEAVTL